MMKLRNLTYYNQPPSMNRIPAAKKPSIPDPARMITINALTEVPSDEVDNKLIKEMVDKIRKKLSHLDSVRCRVSNLQRRQKDMNKRESAERRLQERITQYQSSVSERIEERQAMILEEKQRIYNMRQKLKLESEHRSIQRHKRLMKELQIAHFAGWEGRDERSRRENELEQMSERQRQKKKLQANYIRKTKEQGRMKRELEKQKKMTSVVTDREKKILDMYKHVDDLQSLLVGKQKEEEMCLKRLQNSMMIRNEVRRERQSELGLRALVSPRVRDLMPFQPPNRISNQQGLSTFTGSANTHGITTVLEEEERSIVDVHETGSEEENDVVLFRNASEEGKEESDSRRLRNEEMMKDYVCMSARDPPRPRVPYAA